MVKEDQDWILLDKDRFRWMSLRTEIAQTGPGMDRERYLEALLQKMK